MRSRGGGKGRVEFDVVLVGEDERFSNVISDHGYREVECAYRSSRLVAFLMAHR
jgi:hypothetical protein